MAEQNLISKTWATSGSLVFGRVSSYYQIYNRWGELLHKSTTSDSWDLTYNGETIPSGRYIYVVTLYAVTGENRTEKGTLNVIK